MKVYTWVKYRINIKVRINYKIRFDQFTYDLLSRGKMVKEQIRFVKNIITEICLECHW